MSEEGSDSDSYVKPAPRKKQKTLDDFVAGKPKPKTVKPTAAPKKAAPAKKSKSIASDGEESDPVSFISKPRTPPPKRVATARGGATKKSTYIEVSSEEEEGNKANQTDDVFELSDD
jgi:hypothetical protein